MTRLVLAITFLLMSVPVWAAQHLHEDVIRRHDLSAQLKMITRVDSITESEDLYYNSAPLFILDGDLQSKEDYISQIKSYLNTDEDQLLGGQIDLSDLEVGYFMEAAPSIYRPGMVYVEMHQYYQERKVEGAQVRFAIKKIKVGAKDRHVVMRAHSNIVPNNALDSVRLSKDSKRAKDKAAEALGVEDKPTTRKEEQIIRYVDGEGFIGLQRIVFDEKTDVSIYIREADGEVFGIQDNRHYSKDQTTVHGTIQGRGVFDPLTAGGVLDVLSLKDLELRLDFTNTAHTNANGAFNFPGLFMGYLEAELKGRWVDVNNHPSAGPDLAFMQDISGRNPVKIVFNKFGNDESDTAQVNAYYHTTFIHDWVKNILPSFTGIDISLPTNVNDSIFFCNAYYDLMNMSINFTLSGELPLFELFDCYNTANDTLIYHEYGHFLDDAIGGILFPPSALSEGWGDLLASYASNQPEIGAGFYGQGTYLRRADNTYRYPRTGDAQSILIHDLGQSWAGFAWDLREEFIGVYGATQGVLMAEDLVISTMLANSGSILEALIDLIILDDDDGNLANGTPNFNLIESAARKHGMYPFPVGAMYLGPPVNHQLFLGNSLIDLNGATDTSIAGYNFSYYQLFYGVGVDPSSWTAITPQITTPVSQGLLGVWDTNGLADGTYTVRLEIQTDIPIIKFGYSVLLHINHPWQGLSLNNRSKEYPATSTTHAIWWADNPDQFVLHDYATGNQTGIVGSQSFDPQRPHIAGNYVLWPQGNPGMEDIIIKNVNGGFTFHVDPTSYRQLRPSMDGLNITWEDERNGNRDVYYCAFDLAINRCPSSQQITSDPSRQDYVDISGNNIVWQTNENGNFDIGHHDIASGLSQRITGHSSAQKFPKVSGDHIVYMTQQNGEWDLALYQISTGVETVFPLPGEQVDPDMDYPWVVWVNRADEWAETTDIVAFNLQTAQIITVTDNFDSHNSRPSISGNRVIWESNMGAFDPRRNVFSTLLP